jgi:hypothetical protein
MLLTLCGAVYGQAPCTPTVTGRLETIHFKSKVFQNTRTEWVWLPPGFDAAKHYPVLYILDGASAFNACTAFQHLILRNAALRSSSDPCTEAGSSNRQWSRFQLGAPIALDAAKYVVDFRVRGVSNPVQLACAASVI